MMHGEIENQKGLIFKIQKFCTDDGPGIRTTVFLKGCNLKCMWCHNPEGLSAHPNIEIDFNRCLLCGKCAKVCPNGCHKTDMKGHLFSTEKCNLCGTCMEVCPIHAIALCGKELTAKEVMKVVLADKGFYEHSGGGITISGGEPFLQADFVLALSKLAKENKIHLCIETSGSTSFDKIAGIAPYVDLFLFDIKESEEERHKKYIGISQKRILSNLEKLNGMGNKIIIRCPIIPGVNNRQTHFDALLHLYNTLENIIDLQLMPYHRLSEGKQKRYGLPSAFHPFDVPSAETIQQWNEYIGKKKQPK